MAHQGEIVSYKLTQNQASAINHRRGLHPSSGNSVRPGDTVPVVVVRVWPENRINGQAILDGEDNIWVTSATYAADGVHLPGTWLYAEEI